MLWSRVRLLLMGYASVRRQQAPSDRQIPVPNANYHGENKFRLCHHIPAEQAAILLLWIVLTLKSQLPPQSLQYQRQLLCQVLDLNKFVVAAGKDGDDGHRMIDVYKLGRDTRKQIVQQALATHDNDQELFMTKLKARMDACAFHLAVLTAVFSAPIGPLNLACEPYGEAIYWNYSADVSTGIYCAEAADSVYVKSCDPLQCGHQTLHGGGPL